MAYPAGFPANPLPERLFSMDALHRAWRLVRRNGPSPGSDGVTIKAFERNLDAELRRLRGEILSGNYQPQPLRRFYVKKSSGGKRPLTIWALRDRVAQRVVHDYLTPLFEVIFLDCSYGFRPGQSVEQAVQAIIQVRDGHRKWVVDADIKDCFDSIPTDLLMSQVLRVTPSSLAIRLIRQWLHTPIYRRRQETAGVSQGSVLSPQLANLYLHHFDLMIQASLPDVRLVRFADDFVILCRYQSEAEWALKVARRSLANLRLRINEEKTRIVHFREGFTFLGTTFKGMSVYCPTPDNGNKE